MFFNNFFPINVGRKVARSHTPFTSWVRIKLTVLSTWKFHNKLTTLTILYNVATLFPIEGATPMRHKGTINAFSNCCANH